MVRSGSGGSVGVVWRLIRTGSAKFQRVRRVFLASLTLLALTGNQTVHAGQCFTDGPRYQLESDSVEWRMKIRSNDSCVRGVRFSYVWNASVSLVSPPKFGLVTLMGPGFLYTAKPGFHGEDSFTVGVSGSKNKTSGFSTIHVLVSVLGTEQASLPSHAHFEAR
jgi:Bacterial Ig domain